MGDSDNCKPSSSGSIPKKQKVSAGTYKQKYTSAWERESSFSGWLSASDKGAYFYFCKVCNVHGAAGKSEILKHSKSQKHLSAMAHPVRAQEHC